MPFFQGPPIPDILNTIFGSPGGMPRGFPGGLPGGLPGGFNIRINLAGGQSPQVRKKALAVLELPEGANEEDIQKAYKRLAKIWHPDKHPPDKKEFATKKFKEITQAKDLLTKNEAPPQGLFHNPQQSESDIVEEVVEEFMRNESEVDSDVEDYRTVEEERDADAEDILNFLSGAQFPGHHGHPGHQPGPGANPRVFFFGPQAPARRPPRVFEERNNAELETVRFRVRIDIKDSWNNGFKLLPIKKGNKTYNLRLPLYYKDLTFENKTRKYPWSEISVQIQDKPDDKFRRVSSWDLETTISVPLTDLYHDHLMEVELPDGSKKSVKWQTKVDLPNIFHGAEKGFFLLNQGFPLPDKKMRGKLWVLLDIQIPESLGKLKQQTLKTTKPKPIPESSLNAPIPEWTEQGELWSRHATPTTEDRDIIFPLSSYCQLSES
jgi:hypothetical protein